MQRNIHAVREIKQRLNLVDLVRRYVQLRRVGPRWIGPCPFHQETKPSFSVNEEEGFFYCFGCQAAGDVFDFYGRINGLDFKETLAQLAEETGVRLEPVSGRAQRQQERASSQRQEMLRMHDLAARHFAGNLKSVQGRICRDYIARRGLSPEIVERFGLGWSLPDWQSLTGILRRSGFADELGVASSLVVVSDKGDHRVYDRFRGRLMFPISSLSGRIVAFGGRIIGDEDIAKYINSGDSPIYTKGEHVYGLSQARRAVSLKNAVMLTEGDMDVLTLHQFGYEHAAGVLGTALTPEQVKRLSGFTPNLELLFDGDGAGRKAALRACAMCLPLGLSCKVILFPQGEDIDSLLRTHGQDAFESLRSAAPDGMAFCIQALRAMAPRDAVEWTRNFLRQQILPELASRYVSLLATGLGLTETQLRGQLEAEHRAGGQERAARPAVPAPDNVRDRQILTFAVRYPHALARLQAAGAHLALESQWAKRLWHKLENPDTEEIVRCLDEKERGFWVVCRTQSAPLDNEQKEFAALRAMLENTRISRAPFAAALRQNAADPETDTLYIQALQRSINERKRMNALQQGETTDG
jgi:DNA primase